MSEPYQKSEGERLAKRVAALQAWIATPDAEHRPPLPPTNS